MSFSLDELAASLGATVQGDAGLIVKSIAPLDQVGTDQLASLFNPLHLNQAVSSGAGAIITSLRDLETPESQGRAAGRNWLITANPYATFARVAQRFVALAARLVVPSIHPSTGVEEGAKVPASCSIDSNVTIKAGTVLDERVRIAGSSFVDAGARIGDDALLHTNVSIYHDREVGARCILHSGIVIGAGGFGFAPDFGPQGGEWVKIPQVGRVVIGSDAEVDANTAIDRDTIADTMTEQDCRVGNQIQIAHNAHAGAYTVIVGCVVISGSTKIGRYCIIGGTANFASHLTITDRVTVLGGTSITKSITKPDDHFASVFPFMPHGDWERSAAIVRGLTRMREWL